MARRLKTWGVLFLVGSALIVSWALPPEGGPFIRYSRDREELTPAEQRARELSGRVRAANAALRQVRWEDSLSALLSPGTVTVDLRPHLGERAARMAHAQVDRELRGVELRAAVGLFLLSSPASGRLGFEQYTGEGAAGPRCITVLVHSPRWDVPSERLDRAVIAALREESLLGPCLLWARHGPPGSGIRPWLERGGYGFAERPPSQGAGEVRHRRTAFGLARGYFADDVVPVGPRVQGCLAGRAEQCADVVLRDDARPSAARLPVSGPVVFERGPDEFGGVGGSMLADLEAEIGPEAFARFWRSERPVREAFREAAGRELGPWVLEWARARLGSEPAGPLVPLRTAGLGGLGLLLMAGLGAAAAVRRQVG